MLQPATPPSPGRDDDRWNRTAALLPSLMGPIGLYHVSTAEVGPADHLRLALHGQFFHASNFLIAEDHDTRLAGELSFGFTPERHFELFGALLNSSNRNSRPPEANRQDPELIKSFGDLVLGAKTVVSPARGVALGGELGFRLMSAVSALAISPSSTSLWVGPVLSVDLRDMSGVPLRLHVNASFYLDNSHNLYDFGSVSRTTEEAALFAYGIEKSRVRLAVGADVPIDQMPVPLQLMGEYHAEIVTSSADPSFAGLPATNRDQQWLTFGLRARVAQAVTLDAGIDVGLRSPGYAFGPPIPPYDLLFGVGVPLDIDAIRKPLVVTQTIEKEAPPSTGRLTGTVAAAADGHPVGGAIVTFAGRSRARVASDPDGGFASGPLAPGPVDVDVTAPGFEIAKSSSVIAAGSLAELDFKLTAKPPTGVVRGTVEDSAGHGLAATLRFIGVATYEAQADTNGSFGASLPAGPYRVRVESIGFPPRELPLDLGAGQDARLNIKLRPPDPNVALADDTIDLRHPIRFSGAGTELAPAFKNELDAVAQLLEDHPEVRKLRIEAYANRGTNTKSALGLTQRQAQAVADYLISKGTPADHLDPVGLGAAAVDGTDGSPQSLKNGRRIELIVVR
jgi:outer membrane protein OmpA-like peptidoglycan-associated protein